MPDLPMTYIALIHRGYLYAPETVSIHKNRPDVAAFSDPAYFLFLGSALSKKYAEAAMAPAYPYGSKEWCSFVF